MCKFNVVLTIAVVLFAASTAQAELLLSDNFNGADGAGINDGLGARQGGPLATVSYLSSDDLSNGVPITIQGNMIEFGGRLDQFAPDHDFVDASITSSGGFVVEFDINPIVGAPGGGQDLYGAGIAMGRTAAQAADGNAIGWGDTSDTSCDWSIQLRDNGTFTSAGQGSWNLPSGTFDPDPTDENYHVKIQVDTNSFAAGQAYSVSVWVDGVQVNVGVAGAPVYSSTWDADGTNYMGFEVGVDGGSSMKSTVDNLSVSTLSAAIPEPSTMALLATGLIGLLAYAWRKRK